MDPPAWLLAKADQRIAELDTDKFLTEILENKPPFADSIVIKAAISCPEDIDPETIAVWARTCDNCHKVCTLDMAYYPGAISIPHKGGHVLLEYGVCGQCAETFPVPPDND